MQLTEAPVHRLSLFSIHLFNFVTIYKSVLWYICNHVFLVSFDLLMISTFQHIVIICVVYHVTLYLFSKSAYYSGEEESVLQLTKPNVQIQCYNNH
jgi:4-amino-4-deoxy-L-arabinose transferase-like glycosyltransferase